MFPTPRATLLLLLALAGSAAAAAQPPDQMIRQTTEKVQALIQQNRAQYESDGASFKRMVDEQIVPRFDQQAIGRHVLGRHWKDASDEQKSRFVAAFKNSLVQSYADALLKYHDAVQTQWKPVHAAPDAAEATVHVVLNRKDGQPIPLAFSVHRAGEDWKVFDVSVEGISLATTFRSQFNAEIKQNGLDALIQRLESGGKPLQKESL